MDERNAANGILFYASLYINVILLAVAVITGRWVFILFILLTVGLTAYMMYITLQNMDHLKSIGKWSEDVFSKTIQKVRGWYS